MKYRLTHSEGSSRLLLIFAGWGMDDIVFSHIRRPGYDVMVVWDYTSFYIDWSCVGKYSEICLFAWSMGVYVASQTVQAIEPKITLRIAVNGTVRPVDNRFGVPEDTFYDTIATLSTLSLQKFYDRLTDSPEAFRLFNSRRPNRSVEELRDELLAISDRLILDTPSAMRWDLAVIGRNDKILSTFSQLRAWNDSHTPVRIVNAGHFFDFSDIIERHIVDKSALTNFIFFDETEFEHNAVVHVDVVERMMRLVKANKLGPAIMGAKNRIIEIGSGTGTLSRRMAALVSDAVIEMWDFAAPVPSALPLGRKYRFRNCDPELEISKLRPSSVEHIFSASAVQWFNSPEKFLIDAARALRPEGYVFLSTFTEGNLHEVSDMTGKTFPLLSPERWIEMAERNFNVVASESYTRDLDFATPFDAVHYLRMTEVMRLASDLAEHLPMRLDGRYHLTYKPFILILQKK